MPTIGGGILGSAAKNARAKVREKFRKQAEATTTKTKQTALPEPSDAEFNHAAKEMLEQVTGKRGDKLDSMVTFRDLRDGTLAKNLVETAIDAGAKVTKGVEADKLPTGGYDGRDDGLLRPNTPPEPDNIVASAAYSRIIITWENPTIGNYAYTEVYRATTDNVAEALLIGSSTAPVYTDVTGGGFTGFYWLRVVNDKGNRSGFAGGVSATTPMDFDVIRDAATSRTWQAQHDYSIYNAVIPTDNPDIDTDGLRYIDDQAVIYIAQSAGASGATEPDWDSITAFGQTINDNGIIWKAVEAAKIPFMIDAETGLTVIEGAAIRKASITVAQIQDAFIDNLVAAQGKIGIANIGQGNIFDLTIGGEVRSDVYDKGKAGFKIDRLGNAEFNDVTMRGVLTNGTIDPITGRVSPDGRYIDFRDGVIDEFGENTNGDFVLGDVEDNNYISFKYEPVAKKKILRIRGDVLFKDYYPGDILRFENNAEIAASSLSGTIPPSWYVYEDGKFDLYRTYRNPYIIRDCYVLNGLAYYPNGTEIPIAVGNGKNLLYYKDSSFAGAAPCTLKVPSQFNDDDAFKLKESIMSGNGEATFKCDLFYDSTSQPIYILAIKRAGEEKNTVLSVIAYATFGSVEMDLPTGSFFQPELLGFSFLKQSEIYYVNDFSKTEPSWLLTGSSKYFTISKNITFNPRDSIRVFSVIPKNYGLRGILSGNENVAIRSKAKNFKMYVSAPKYEQIIL